MPSCLLLGIILPAFLILYATMQVPSLPAPSVPLVFSSTIPRVRSCTSSHACFDLLASQLPSPICATLDAAIVFIKHFADNVTKPFACTVRKSNEFSFTVSSSQRDVLCKNLHRNIFFPLSGFLCGHFINRTTASLPNCQSLTLLPPPTDRIRCGEKPQRTKKRVMTKIHQSAWPREREVASAAPLATAFTHEKDQTQCVLARQLACSSQTIVCKSFTWQRPKMQDDARQNCSVKNRVPRNGHEAPRVKNKTMLFVAL